ncbi:MAG: ATP-binding cassette domain-containing protein [Bacteroidetes bacterium]|nr:ATP-binding cassette domain-containing protein [Bacteroidota bacterium]
MKLVLDQLIPYSLKDKIGRSGSAIWNQTISFSQSKYVKVEAPSGTGKTTLTHLLYRVRSDYTGSIKYDQLDLKSSNDNELASLRQNHLSIVFQDLRLFPDLSARENIEVKRLLTPNFSSQDQIDEMAEAIGVSSILEQKIRFCSYGEQQRIAIIRALMQPFDWIILDEPFSHLDQKNIQHSVQLIDAACKKRNAGMIIMGLNKDDYFQYQKELVL